MRSVKRSIEQWGLTNIGSSDMQKVLEELFDERGLSQKEISDMFECDPPAIRYWLKQFGLLHPKPRFEDAIASKGWESLSAFFTDSANVHKTFKQLAEEMGYCYATVSDAYTRFLKSRETKSEEFDEE